MDELVDMYGDDRQNKEGHHLYKNTNNTSSKSVKFVDSKSFLIELNGERIEVVKKSYVEQIASELATTKRSVRSLQSRLNKVTSVLSSALREITKLQTEVSNRGRFK